jgi:hypothetical protein
MRRSGKINAEKKGQNFPLSFCQMSSVFKQLCTDVEQGKITSQDAVVKLDTIPVIELDIDCIEALGNANWIPDEKASQLMRDWVKAQDQVIDEVASSLFVRPVVDAAKCKTYLKGLLTPSNHTLEPMDNIIYQIATSGNDSKYLYTSPVASGLITVSTRSAPVENHELELIFDRPITQPALKYFLSQASKDEWIEISLPPFLRAQIHSYTILGPPKIQDGSKQGGMRSWVLQGWNGSGEWNDLHTVLDDPALNREDARATYYIQMGTSTGDDGFYRHFRIMQKKEGWRGNASICLGGIDFNGKLLVCKG